MVSPISRRASGGFNTDVQFIMQIALGTSPACQGVAQDVAPARPPPESCTDGVASPHQDRAGEQQHEHRERRLRERHGEFAGTPLTDTLNVIG